MSKVAKKKVLCFREQIAYTHSRSLHTPNWTRSCREEKSSTSESDDFERIRFFVIFIISTKQSRRVSILSKFESLGKWITIWLRVLIDKSENQIFELKVQNVPDAIMSHILWVWVSSFKVSQKWEKKSFRICRHTPQYNENIPHLSFFSSSIYLKP